MKRNLGTGSAILAMLSLCLLAGNGRAAAAEPDVELSDVVGHWEFRVERPGGNTLAPQLTISLDNGKPKATYTAQSGAVLDVKNLRIEGSQLRFTVTADMNGTELTVDYTGLPSGDEISGGIDYAYGDRSGQLKFTGKRVPTAAQPAQALAADSATARVPVLPTKLNKSPTALDAYVAAEDDTYAWKVVGTHREPGATTFVVDMTSQTWLKDEEVDRNVWQHWLTIVRPDNATADTALLFIGGGRNGRGAPQAADGRTKKIAMATNTVVAELGMIPNQPLVFNGDGRPRSEDDLIGYTWDHFLQTGDTRWPARLPMVKSVVRAMDTVQALMGSPEGGDLKINDFVVAGGSKRGWTTWMTAAVDSRVAAIAPIVIDVLNVNISMNHHYAAYGFWAPAIGDYVAHKLPQRRHLPRYAELLQLVDPFAYRDRFTMPKCIINAAGDQFFLPDSSQFYFDELPGEKHLCYVPNGDHGLDGTNALDTLVAFHYAIVNGIPRPQFTWTFPDESTIRIESPTKPKRVLLWQAVNEKARDFRVETIGRAYRSSELSAMGDGSFLAKVDMPADGWKAYFCQLEFEIGAPTPLRFTTPVRVVPDTLPFADQEAPLIDDVE